jgi:hypothetical protein
MKPVFIFDSDEQWFPLGVDESLAQHGYHWTNQDIGFTKDDNQVDCLDFPPDMIQPDLPAVVYHRQVRDTIDWDQYWLWYLMNPKNYVVKGEHEGDWEFVQIGSHAGEPLLMTASQHSSGSGRFVWDTERSTQGDPIIYVARDSHANYFMTGRIVEDEADGGGHPLEDYELREFGDWANWSGRWGHSDTSPRSPGKQGDRWNNPTNYHAKAR